MIWLADSGSIILLRKKRVYSSPLKISTTIYSSVQEGTHLLDEPYFDARIYPKPLAFVLQQVLTLADEIIARLSQRLVVDQKN